VPGSSPWPESSLGMGTLTRWLGDSAVFYDADGIAIYHGDSQELFRDLAGGAAVMVTDPPYGMAYQSGWNAASSVAGDADTSARDGVVREWGDRPALMFGRWSISRPFGTKMVLYWDKGDWPGMGDLGLPWGPSTEEIYVLGSGFTGKRSGQIVRDPHRPSGASANHPTEKPVGLMEILLSKCPPGVVIDPFMGSGSTLVAAKNLGRRAIGIELREDYCHTAARRLAQGVLPW